jgi:acylphosphatase
MDETTQACYQFRVRGAVQGVYYRAATREKANALGLRGWVENRGDGSVSVVVCGPETAVETLSDWLWTGPPAARVDSVESEGVADPGSEGFAIV